MRFFVKRYGREAYWRIAVIKGNFFTWLIIQLVNKIVWETLDLVLRTGLLRNLNGTKKDSDIRSIVMCCEFTSISRFKVLMWYHTAWLKYIHFQDVIHVILIRNHALNSLGAQVIGARWWNWYGSNNLFVMFIVHFLGIWSSLQVFKVLTSINTYDSTA